MRHLWDGILVLTCSWRARDGVRWQERAGGRQSRAGSGGREQTAPVTWSLAQQNGKGLSGAVEGSPGGLQGQPHVRHPEDRPGLARLERGFAV